MVSEETNPQSQQNQVDRDLSRPDKTPAVKREKYTRGIAATPASPNSQEVAASAQNTKSAALRIVEGVVNQSVLNLKRQSINDFVQKLDSDRDYRFGSIGDQLLQHQLRQISHWDKRSRKTVLDTIKYSGIAQTHRRMMVTATMGGLQFQRKIAMPYMQKNLAIGYSKLATLKEIAETLASGNLNILTKLDAIKMNTSAPDAAKTTWWKLLRNELRMTSIRRMAGRISDIAINGVKRALGPAYHRILTGVASGETVGSILNAGASSASAAMRMATRSKLLNTPGPDAKGDKVDDGRRQFNEFAKKGLHFTADMLDRFQTGDRFQKYVGAPLGHIITGLNHLEEGSDNTETRPITDPNTGAIVGYDFVKKGEKGDGESGEGDKSPSELLLEAITSWRSAYDSNTLKLFKRLDHLIGQEDIEDAAEAEEALRGDGPMNTVDPLKEVIKKAKEGYRKVTDPDAPDTPTGRVRKAARKVKDKIKPEEKPQSVGRKIKDAIKKADIPTTKLGAMHTVLKTVHTVAEAAASTDRPKATESSKAEPGSARKDPGDKTRHAKETHHTKRHRGHVEDHSIDGLLTSAVDVLTNGFRKLDRHASLIERFEKLSSKIPHGLRKNSYQDELNRRGINVKDGLLPGLLQFLMHQRQGKKNRGLIGTPLSMLLGSSMFRGGLKNAGIAALLMGGSGLVGPAFTAYMGYKGARLAATKTITAAKWANRVLGLGKASRMVGGAAIRGIGPSFGIGLGADIAQHYADKHLKGGEKRLADTVAEAAKWGALGSVLGGPAIGGVAGAVFGTLIANADVVGKALGAFGRGLSKVTSSLWTTVFGRNAKFDRNGHVIQQEHASLLGDAKIALFGRKAKYAKNGELIAPARRSVFGLVKTGMARFFLGKQYSNGEYIQGTSIIENLPDIVTNAVKSLYHGTINKAKSVGKAIGHGAVNIAHGVRNAGRSVAHGVLKAGMGVVHAEEAVGRGVAKTAIGATHVAEDVGTFLWDNNPVSYLIGSSEAIAGWARVSRAISNPDYPIYPWVTEVLSAYGVSDRNLYGYLRSVESTQTNINNGKSKPFNDHDMTYIAGRFGLDNTSADAVNYFKLWYSRRFLPVLGMISAALKENHLTMDSVLGAEPPQIAKVIASLKTRMRSMSSEDAMLKPTATACAQFLKKGAADPGGLSPSKLANVPKYDPRNPNAQAAKGPQNPASPSTLPGTASKSGASPNALPASTYMDPNSTITPQLQDGKVTDQKAYKDAYAGLSAPVKKMVDSSKGLQFTLWSASIQHGAKDADKIFETEYSPDLDESRYMRNIYSSRTTRFINDTPQERTAAFQQLGRENQFAQQLDDGNTDVSFSQMAQEIGHPIMPGGNATLPWSGQLPPPRPLQGDLASRTKEAINYLKTKHGYSAPAAEGIVANLVQESKINPDARGDNNQAYGLAQWHGTRRRAIEAHFKKPMTQMSIDEQLDAVDWELKGGNPREPLAAKAGALIHDIKDPGQAAATVSKYFERPLRVDAEMAVRANVAEGISKQFGAPAPAVTAGGVPINDKGLPIDDGVSRTKTGSGSTPSDSLGGNVRPVSTGGGASSAAPAAPANINVTAQVDHAPVVKAINDLHSTIKAGQASTASTPAPTPAPAPAPAAGNTTVIPIAMSAGNQAKPSGSFIDVSMKKSRVMTGESV